MILDLLHNPYFVIPVIAFFVAQLMKFAVRAWHNEDQGWRRFFGSGDMPSAHTATVVSLAMTAAFESGLSSPALGISFVLAAIVVYDAVNVRRAVGTHGGVLQKLVERMQMPKSEREAFDIGKVLGHRPVEVAAGGMLAATLTLILEHDKWWDWFHQGLSNISDTDIKIFYGISATAVVLGFLVTLIFRRRHLRKLPTSKAIKRAAVRGLVAPGITGLVLTYLLQHNVARFDSAIWLFLVLVWGITVLAVAWIRTFSGAIGRLSQEKEHFSEEKKRLRQSRRRHKKRR